MWVAGSNLTPVLEICKYRKVSHTTSKRGIVKNRCYHGVWYPLLRDMKRKHDDYSLVWYFIPMVIDSEHVLYCNYNCFFSKMNFFQKLHLNTQLQRFHGNGHHIHSINRVICMTQWLQDCINLNCSQHAILTMSFTTET